MLLELTTPQLLAMLERFKCRFVGIYKFFPTCLCLSSCLYDRIAPYCYQAQDPRGTEEENRRFDMMRVVIDDQLGGESIMLSRGESPQEMELTCHL